MLRLSLVTLACFAASACGQSDDDPSGPDAAAAVDAAGAIDAIAIDAPPGTAATVVDCAGVTPVAEIRFVGDALTPRETTVAIGQVVRFHSLGSHTAWETTGLWSADGDTPTCVRFDGPGAYSFYCYFDSANADERGTVTAVDPAAGPAF